MQQLHHIEYATMLLKVAAAQWVLVAVTDHDLVDDHDDQVDDDPHFLHYQVWRETRATLLVVII